LDALKGFSRQKRGKKKSRLYQSNTARSPGKRKSSQGPTAEKNDLLKRGEGGTFAFRGGRGSLRILGRTSREKEI